MRDEVDERQRRPDAETVQMQVILLYIVDRLPGITRDELMNVAIDTLYMDYFSFSLHSTRLVEDGLIHIARRKGEQQRDAQGHAVERCALTPRGQAILAALVNQLPLPMRRHLRERLLLERRDRRDSESVVAGYQPTTDGRFLVSLGILERDAILIELSLTVPNEAIARSCVNRWRTHHDSLYPSLLSEVIYGREETPAASLLLADALPEEDATDATDATDEAAETVEAGD